ncbi:MAG TPA: cytochrome P450 [Acidimicrobiales bacterium]|nr:cytochrome P450 [Acidimicrobiales bacterium]
MSAPASQEDLDTILATIFMTPEGKADPYPGYATVREASALHESGLGAYVVSRYEDCSSLLRDNRLGRGEQGSQAEYLGLTQAEYDIRFPRSAGRVESMLGLDPPDHTRLRSLVAKAFTPKTVEALRPRIQDLTAGLLEGLEGEVDVIPELALKLPITVIGEMLGVPQQDHADLLAPIKVVVRSLATFEPNLEEFTEIYEASGVIDDYFQDLVNHKRAHPAEDMLSELIQAEDAGDKLTEAELLATIMLLFVAGYETTTNLIGNGLRALLLYPDQLKRLRDDRSLVKSAVEETLRYDSPVQFTARVVLHDGVEITGTPIAAGRQIIVLLGGANRDPRAYRDPDTFDVGRSGPPPVSFSGGIHYCLGAALARAEGQIVFDSLVSRYTAIEPAWPEDKPPVYRDSAVLRGLETLPVRLLP